MRLFLAAVAPVLIAAATPAAAGVISFNVGTNMLTADVAGAGDARDDNWNNADAAGAAMQRPAGTTMNWTGNFDGTGTSVTAAATLTINNTSNAGFSNQTDSGTSADDAELFRSIVDLFTGTAAAPNATISVTNIPYALYDVYVYQGGGTVDRIAGVEIGTRSEYMRQVATNPTTAAGYIESDDTTPASGTGATLTEPQGHYVRFEELSSSTLSIDLWGSFASTATQRFRFAGFQIVEVPEPTSLGLLAIGGLSLARRRRASLARA